MARMLDALRRLEATNRLVAPAVASCAVAEQEPTPSPPVVPQVHFAVVKAGPPAVSRATAGLAFVDLEEPPFEPTFGPLVSWDRHDDAYGYASHAIDEALDVLDALANDAAESTSPARLVTQPIVAKVDTPVQTPYPTAAPPSNEVAEIPASAPSLLDEFDPVAVVREQAEEEHGRVSFVGLGDAPAVAADVLSTIQFAEHWATIALEEFGVDGGLAATEYPPPIDDYALPLSVEETQKFAEPHVAETPSPASEAESPTPISDETPTSAVEPVVTPPIVVAENRATAEPPQPVAQIAPPPPRVTLPAREEAARPQPSPAELAAMLDLNDAVLQNQYTQLSERMLHELTATTKTCAALLSIEHQPHVTDVALRTAMTLCRGGKQVLVIDAALADKHLTSGLAMPVEFGLAEVLKGRVPWQQAVRATATPGLCVLPAGRLTPPRLADDDHRLKDVLKELTSQWDLVLLDGGSLAETSARYVASAARNVYLVVRLGETDADAAKQAAQSLSSPEVVLRGCIVTNAN